MSFRMERAQTIAGSGTRSRSVVAATKTGSVEVKVEAKATPEEIKDKLEQQLKIQRAAHQQKRTGDKPAVTPTTTAQQVIKLVPNSSQQGKV